VSCKAVSAHVAHGDSEGVCADASSEFKTSTVEDSHLVHNHGSATDPRCQQVTSGCEPAILISADKLRDYSDGPQETALIGEYLMTNPIVKDYVIDREAWPCIWEELIIRNKGPATFKDRQIEEDPNFSPFMLGEMIYEIDRMITKYSGSEWAGNDNAERLVSLLSEHLVMLQTELDDVNAGRRTLGTRDIYGPHEIRPEPERSELMKKLRMRFVASMGDV
jgi:hypothetical protein